MDKNLIIEILLRLLQGKKDDEILPNKPDTWPPSVREAWYNAVMECEMPKKRIRTFRPELVDTGSTNDQP